MPHSVNTVCPYNIRNASLQPQFIRIPPGFGISCCKATKVCHERWWVIYQLRFYAPDKNQPQPDTTFFQHFPEFSYIFFMGDPQILLSFFIFQNLIVNNLHNFQYELYVMNCTSCLQKFVTHRAAITTQLWDWFKSICTKNVQTFDRPY